MASASSLVAALGEEESLDPGARELISRLDEFGITRIAETTRLDRIGIRTHSATKPGTTDVLSIYSGKGLTVSDSVRSAVMECLERTGTLWRRSDVSVYSEAEAREMGNVLPPSDFTEASAEIDPAEPVAWVWANRVGGTERSLVPAQLAFNGYAPDGVGALPFATTTSNGLGAGFDERAAVKHALRELIERDVVSCVELLSSHIHLNELHRLARSFGIDLASNEIQDALKYVRRVEPGSLPNPARGIFQRLTAAGLQVEVKALPNDFGVPCFAASTTEEVGLDRFLCTSGYAAGYPILTTVVRALLELCQSRATHFQGGREDDSVVPEKQLRISVSAQSWQLCSTAQSLAFEELDSCFLPGEDSVSCYLGRMSAVGLGPPHAFVRWPYRGICVARVLVPEIETWHATAGESRLGLRMRRARVDPNAWACQCDRRHLD